MAVEDLRCLIKKLEDNKKLIRIKESINAEPDIPQYVRASNDMPQDGPAFIFENIKGYAGQKMVINSMGGWDSFAIAMGLEPGTSLRAMYDYFCDIWEDGDKNGTLNFVNREDAPCLEEVIEGDDVNLYDFPNFRANYGDGGFFISKGALITHDRDEPDNLNLANVGMYRMQIQERNITGLQVMADHDCAHHFRKYEAAGENMPICICVGAPPAVVAMATVPLKQNQSELKYASALVGGEPLNVVKMSNGLVIPSDTEYVLEGEVLCGARFPEGPFGEFPGTYSGVRDQCRIKINRIYHRKNPIWENLYLGARHVEGNAISNLLTSVISGMVIKERFPDEIVAVNALIAHGMLLIISAKNRIGNFGKAVLYNAASSSAGLGHGKIIVVVDPEVDPFDLEQVLFAVTFRTRPDKDVIIVPWDIGMGLDPCNNPIGISGRIMIDATTPKYPDTMRDVVPIDLYGSEEKFEIIKKIMKEMAAA